MGFWAARRRILDEPARYRRPLVVTAVAGLGTAVVGGLPAALMYSGAWTPPPAPLDQLLATLHYPAGFAGGLGWAALMGLLALRLDAARGRLATAVEALGQRSMSFYLLQSVVFVLLFTPYALNLGAELSVTEASLVAVGVWTASLVLADLMRRAAHRGPAEILLRRLTYGRPAPAGAAGGPGGAGAASAPGAGPAARGPAPGAGPRA
nr:DUF418 domain-containing protein [Streptomonospora nanhaiensis]